MGDFTMPSLGADMEAGTLVEWKVKAGDAVKRGDLVAVVETQKGAIDVEIFEDGRVEALLVEPGAKVPVGTVLARLSGGDGAPRPAPPVPAPPPAPAPAPMPPAPGTERLRASPAAKAAARELGVALEQVKGTGPGGAITREDVERAAPPAKPPAAPARPGMRQAIAAAMARSKREVPHYYLSMQIDLVRPLEWLRTHNAPRAPGERLLPVVLLLKAVGRAARAVPELNGFYEAGVFKPAPAVHVGVAIALREGGLVVPALHDVDAKPVDQLGRELGDLIERARRGQLRSSELSDATVTVTSLGERGVDSVFGVIFPPQVAIVGFGRVTPLASVVDGQCVAREGLTATLAADHRVSDGHRGGVFLSRIATLLQQPEAL